MKIGGLGELENIRKALQKEARTPPQPAPEAPKGASSDAVEISQAGKYLSKLQQIPEVREAEVERILEKVQNGTLLTPEALRDGIHSFLNDTL
jgi:anti-sigma28 factor (negative regulator of flagellin synthesis)